MLVTRAAVVVSLVLAGCARSSAPSPSSRGSQGEAGSHGPASSSTAAAPALAPSSSASPAAARAGATREERCLEAARVCGARLIAGDDKAVADCMPPEGLRASGGRAAVLAELAKGRGEMASQGVRIERADIDAPHEVVSVDDRVFAIVPQRVTVKVPSGHLVSKSYLVGVSTDDGETWRFLDGAGLDRARLKRLFPRFPDALALPTATEPELVP